jgi:hypothetical protein
MLERERLVLLSSLSWLEHPLIWVMHSSQCTKTTVMLSLSLRTLVSIGRSSSLRGVPHLIRFKGCLAATTWCQLSHLRTFPALRLMARYSQP